MRHELPRRGAALDAPPPHAPLEHDGAAARLHVRDARLGEERVALSERGEADARAGHSSVRKGSAPTLMFTLALRSQSSAGGGNRRMGQLRAAQSAPSCNAPVASSTDLKTKRAALLMSTSM